VTEAVWSLLILGLACRPQPPPTPSAPPAAPEVPARLAYEARRAELDGMIRAYVQELQGAGRYHCCIQVPCTTCALLSAGCACADGLRRGEPVCEECALMWSRGQGAIPGVSKDQVRSFLEASRPARPAGAPCDCEHDKGSTDSPGGSR
jgi:hypothetical protein